MSDTFKSVLNQAKCLNCGTGLLIESIKTRLCPACERDLERSSRLTATKHDAAKPRHSLLPPHALASIIAVLEFGAARYGERNWMGGMKWSRCFDATMRHLWRWFRGEDIDPDSGLPHLAHAIVSLMFLIDYQATNTDGDDRHG